MNELLEKHEIDDSFYIYLQANSTVWLARFKIGGKWISRTTKQRDKAKAIMAAVRVKTECDIKHDNGIAIQTKAFKQVAELAITRMQETPKGAKGQGSFKDYEWFLRKYHIPFFDRTHITSIDQVKLAEFDRWREKTLGRAPSQSTLKSHNVALQRVFDEAVIRRWMTESQVPSLTTTGGAAGTRRDYFTAQEVQKIADAFPEWIRNSRNRAVRDVRQLLYTYFQFAVHTGLRPGTEMDNLRWNDIELKEDHVVIIVRKGKTTLYTGSRKAIGHSTVREMVLDMHERSLDDEKLDEIPDDYNPLVFRLPDGSTTSQLGRNFTMLLRELGMETGPGGKRTLYSLRHTYISLRLLEGVSAAICVQVQRDGISYRLVWRQDDPGYAVEEWDTGTGSFTPSTSQVVTAQRFPVRLFSQGQIAALAGDSQQALLNVIDDAADTQSQLAAFDEARRAFLAARAQFRELDGKLQGREPLTLALQDVQRKLARFEGADHAVVLKNYQRTSRQSRELERQFETTADLSDRLKAFAADLQAEDLAEGLFDSAEDDQALSLIQALHAAIAKARQEVEKSAAALQERGQVLRNEFEASPSFARIGAAKAAYEQLKADLQQQGVSDPSEYGRLVQEKQRLETELKQLEALQKQQTELREKAKSCLEKVQSARRAISAQRSAFLKETLQGNTFVRIELIPYSRDAQAIAPGHVAERSQILR